MKIIDKRGNLFGKISIVDIGIVLLVIVAVLGTRMYFSRQKGEVKVVAKTIPITLKVECTQMIETMAGSFQVGNEIYNTVDGNYIGKIVDVMIKDSEMTSKDLETGTFVKTRIPERYDVTIVIESSGHVTEKDIAVNGEKLLIGTRAYLRSAGYAYAGFYTEIQYD